MMAGGGPDQRSMDFKGSGKRLLAQFRPERVTLYAMLLRGRAERRRSAVVGPKILGQATDLVFAGIVGRQMPAAPARSRSLEGMRERRRRRHRRHALRHRLHPRPGHRLRRGRAGCCCSRSAVFLVAGC